MDLIPNEPTEPEPETEQVTLELEMEEEKSDILDITKQRTE